MQTIPKKKTSKQEQKKEYLKKHVTAGTRTLDPQVQKR